MRIWPCCVSAAWRYTPAVLGVCLIAIIACGGPRGEATDDAAVGAGAMTVESAAFANGGDIPARYTCEGENVSPPLTWEGTPDGAVTLALICDDPDAPLRTYSHWVLYDLPPETADLPEAVPSGTDLAIGGMQGRNDFGDVAYGGPCPPTGEHRYDWTLYALDVALDLGPEAQRDDVLSAMEGHVLATGQLMGRYQRAD